MHLLLLLPRVPLPEECARTSVDSTWLTRLADHHDLVVAVDENSPGATVLRDADVTVHVSDKRHVYLPDGRVDADTAFASWVAARHAEQPFDLVAASSDRPSTGPVRDAVRGVPWAVLAASGPTALATRLGVDQSWLRGTGHELWAAASAVAAADLALGPVAPQLLGLATGDVPTGTLLPVPEPMHRTTVTGELVVVVATGVSATTATDRLEEALGRIDLRTATTVVVLHAPPVTGAEELAPALAAAVPAGRAQQVVLVPTERHGAAGAWLDGADGLVLADPSELLIPAVARAASVTPTVVLATGRPDPDVPGPPLVVTAPPVREDGTAELLAWTTPGRVAATLRGMRRASPADVVVLHAPEAAAAAAGLRAVPALDRLDVVVTAVERPPFGMANPRNLDGTVVALHRRTWNAVADELAGLDDLPALVARLACLSGTTSHTLGFVPVPADEREVVRPAMYFAPLALEHGPLPGARYRPPPARSSASARPAASTATAPSDTAPTADVRTWARRTGWSTRVRLARPWRFGLADEVRAGGFPDEVASWAKQHTLADRARLALPWRWGLLPRAMEGRW